MSVDVRFPAGGDATLTGLLGDADPQLEFGDERVLDFFASLAGELTGPRLLRRYPELGQVGYFLRRASLRRQLAGVTDGPDRLRLPRGLVFHVAPANVPVMFLYSWAVSALAGNTNVVRVSARAGAVAEAVLDTACQAAAGADEVIARTQAVVSYERDDDQVTAALSRRAQARVIWGGDASVAALRGFTTGAATHDLVFPDRYSASVISAQAWLTADAPARAAAVRAFHNDIRWYDQAACGSPLTLFWLGAPSAVDQAATTFLDALDALARQEPPFTPAMQLERQVRVLGLAVEGRIASVRFDRTPVTLGLLPATGVLDRWSGAGVLATVQLSRLEELPALLDRRAQTVTHFGLPPAERDRLARLVGARGVDRVVPVGEALTFDPTWDGFDLLRELSRVVSVR